MSVPDITNLGLIVLISFVLILNYYSIFDNDTNYI